MNVLDAQIIITYFAHNGNCINIHLIRNLLQILRDGLCFIIQNYQFFQLWKLTTSLRNLRDFEVFYTQPEIIYKDLNESFLEQINYRCLNCQEGWIQDEVLQNCHPICGDGIIQGQEECDDSNLISRDSCYLCQYSCIDYCQICQFGICLLCQDRFELSVFRSYFMTRCDEESFNHLKHAMIVVQDVKFADIQSVNSVKLDGNLQIIYINLFVEMDQLL
ncbi:unnamed protein product [Paramecium sonneborni]|uniref:Uncharacterized protein n=1 Tax=Paramecium sonneborni TaxID=65129 RepID=A0A8S1RRG0_9CILI|nr:unnamed protein product [Paramecium sonneborni]